MNDIYSSRKIEKACKRDINFMWLLRGRKAPDHNTIARFRSKRLVGVVDDLFNQLVEKLKTYGEVEFKNIFIDGTKIEANANKYTFVWKKSTDKFQAKLQEKIKENIEKINFEFKTEYIISEPEAKIEYLQEILKFLNKNREHENIEFVHGQGKRKTKIQKFIENLSEFIEKQKNMMIIPKLLMGEIVFQKLIKIQPLCI
nr:transposase [Clostridium sp. FP2]